MPVFANDIAIVTAFPPRFSLPATALVLVLIGSGAAHADDMPDFAGATLTGDWGGARSTAWENGIHLEGGLKDDLLRVRGGGRDTTRNISHLDLKARADLDRLFGWKDGVAYLNVIDNRGTGPNVSAGSLMGVSNIEVPVPTTRIFHAWVQKGFLDDRISLLAGIYPIDSEFFAMESASALANPSYGTPSDLALTNAPSIFNNAAFGVRAKWYAEDRSAYAMAALMDGVPNDPAHPKRTAVKLSGRDGAFAIAELGWMPLEQHHAFDFEPTDPAGTVQSPAVTTHEKYGGIAKYAAGLWQYSRRRDDLIDTDAAGAPLRRRSHGGYVLAERTLFGLPSDPLRNLTAFARYTFADPDTVAIERSWNLGFKWRGLVASRPQDSLTVGWTEGWLAGKYRRTLERPATTEQSFELAWRIEYSPWLAVQPGYQRIRHPGGETNAAAVSVVGARVELVF